MSIRQYWFVLWELTKRELKRKYARSFLGILWSCVSPSQKTQTSKIPRNNTPDTYQSLY